jgi:UDP-N-acetylmuramoyl-tripeptide--D-alanyl-D-alanine ligase
MHGPNLLCEGYAEGNNLTMNVVIKFTEGKEYHFPTRLTGTYNLENILAAACIGKYFAVNEKDIIEAIREYTPSNNRSQLVETGKNTFIMDAYNANPVSMEEAINNFLKIDHPKKMMILGDMLELGEWSEEEHLKVLRKIHESEFNNIYLVGPQFSKAAETFPFPVYRNIEELNEHFEKNPVSKQLILLKGSRGMRLEKIIDNPQR